MMSQSTQRNRGITLVELMVVMALLGLTTAIVAPQFSRGLDKFVLRSAGGRLAVLFRHAQIEARAGQIPIAAVYENNRFVLYRNQEVLRTFALPAGIDIANASGRELTLVFLGSGLMVGPSEISISNARGRKGTLHLGVIMGPIEFHETLE